MQYIETCQLGQGRAEGAPDNPEMNGPGHVPIPLHFWTLQSEVHIILICWKSFDFFFSPNHVTKTGGGPDVAPGRQFADPCPEVGSTSPKHSQYALQPSLGTRGTCGQMSTHKSH